MGDQLSPWLTREEAAAYARVTAGTVDRWARDGKITKYRVTGTRSVRFLRTEIDACMTPEPEPVNA